MKNTKILIMAFLDGDFHTLFQIPKLSTKFIIYMN